MRLIHKGATSQPIYVEIKDSTSTTGGLKTGLAYNTSSLTAYYTRNGAAAVAITLATQTVTGAYSSGGFVEVSSANAPGLYRLDVPDAAFASGVDSVVVTLKGATGMVQVSEEIQLTAVDLQDSVRGGMTALPNAAAEAAGGLFTRGTGAGQINQANNGYIDVDVGYWSHGTVAAVKTTGVPVVDTRMCTNAGTAQAGSSNTITLQAAGGSSATDHIYEGQTVVIVSSTGAIQSRVIAGYVGSTRVATVTPAWVTNPSSSSVYAIYAGAQSDVEAWLLTAPVTPAVAGVPIVDLKYILGTILTETAGQIAAGFKKLFNVATPVMDLTSVIQTGDSFARIGAPATTSIAADLAAIDLQVTITESGTLQGATSTTATLRSGASAIDNDPTLVGRILYIEAGTGAGQGSRIASYVGATKVATVDGWRTTTPDNTSKYVVF